MIFAMELSIFFTRVYNHAFHREETGIPSSNTHLDISEKLNLWELTTSLFCLQNCLTSQPMKAAFGVQNPLTTQIT